MAGGASGDDGEDGDFELNLAPIIDCFTVLITYMLVSASFITINAMEVNVAATTTAPQPQEQTFQASVAIELSATHEISFKVNDRKPASFTVPARDGSWDLAGMESTTQKLLEKWPTLKEINVKANDELEYREIVKVVENLKGHFAAVYLGE